MNFIDAIVRKFDKLQQSHRPLSFFFAVIAKYSDDSAGNKAALITYYGFVSIFPLLIVVTSIVNIFLGNGQLRTRLIADATQYFPILGPELQSNVHGFRGHALSLIISVPFILYGARGAANQIQDSFNGLWRVPKKERPGWPINLLKSIAITLVGGGLIWLAAILSGIATSFGHSLIYRLLSILISFCVLLAMFIFVFTIARASSRIQEHQIIKCAVLAATGIAVLQVLGGLLITHELRHLTTLYGTFALVLGIIFWIYLQVQVVIYSIEIITVKSLKLWPKQFTDGKTIDQ